MINVSKVERRCVPCSTLWNQEVLKLRCLFCAYCQEEDIRRRTSAAGINADAASSGLGVSNALGGGAAGGDEATQELAAAVESLPKLLEQKKGLEMHTNILKVCCIRYGRRLAFRQGVLEQFGFDERGTRFTVRDWRVLCARLRFTQDNQQPV